MKFRPFDHNVTILAYEKDNFIYAATYAWFMQVGENEVIGLLGEQSVTANIIKKGDIVGINVCSKEQLELAGFIGDTHSNEINKLKNVTYEQKGSAILLKESRCKMICEVVDILHLEGIEVDNLVYFKVLEYCDNLDKKHLLTSDFK